MYTCVARNELGIARSTGYLRVFNRPRIYEAPAVSYERRVNESLEMPCSAFIDPNLDVAYVWSHNGLRINFTKMPQFSEGTKDLELYMQRYIGGSANYPSVIENFEKSPPVRRSPTPPPPHPPSFARRQILGFFTTYRGVYNFGLTPAPHPPPTPSLRPIELLPIEP